MSFSQKLRYILSALDLLIDTGRGSFMSNMSKLIQHLRERGYEQYYDQFINRRERNWISRYTDYVAAICHDFFELEQEEPAEELYVEDFPDRAMIQQTKIRGKLFKPGSNELRDDISLRFGPGEQDLALYTLQQIKQASENTDNELWGNQRIAIVLDREATEQDGARVRNQQFTRVLPVSYFINTDVVVPDSLEQDIFLRIASDQGEADRIDITRIQEIKIFTMEKPQVERELILLDIRQKAKKGEELTPQEQIALDYDSGKITEQNNPYNNDRYYVRRVERSGAFFPYVIREGVKLTEEEQRLFDIIVPRDVNCLIHCLRYFLVPETVLASISQRFTNSEYVLIRYLQQIATDYDLTIRLYGQNGRRLVYGSCGLVVDIYCDFRCHFIIYEKSIITFYKRLFDERLVRKMTSQEYYKERDALGYAVQNWCPSCIDSRRKTYQFREDYGGIVMFADFETVFRNESGLIPHRVYLWKLKCHGNMFVGYDVDSFIKAVWRLSESSTKAKRTAIVKGFYKAFRIRESWCSEKKMLEKYSAYPEICLWLRNYWKRPTVRCYFHNLSFDGCFIISEYQGKRLDVIEKGSELWSIKIHSKNVTVQFVDSLKIIRAPLRKFSSLFGLSIEKELLPYDLYTEENLRKYENAQDFRDWIVTTDWFAKLKEEDKQHFLRVSAGLTILQYSAYYCGLDVEVLSQGLNIFRENMKALAGLDVCNFLSLPSLAYEYLQREALSKIQGLYEYSGIVDKFVRKCAVGGRVATIRNQKCLVNMRLCDFDAVSLYPTAMSNIQVPVGKEEYFEGGSLYELEKQYAYFIVEARIKAAATPIITHRNHPPFLVNSKGSLTWSDYFEEDTVCYFDSILLRPILMGYGCGILDYIEIVCGLGWKQVTSDFPLRPCIERIFNERLIAKKKGNTIASEIFKLLMNSSYGKLGQHPIYYKTIFKKNSSADVSRIDGENLRFMERHKLEKYDMIGDKLKFKVRKNLLAQYRDVVLYNQILSMSKAQMYRVMFLAEDLGIKIFYQDTDSMHIEYDKLEQLSKAYKERYGEELIGSELGQFHSDFCPNDGTVLEKDEEVLYSRRSIFLGKKAYIDELVTSRDRVCYMFRMKGISHSVILKKARDLGCGLWGLYEKLARGEELVFNLAELNPCMKFSRYSVINQEEFVRRVKFGGELVEY